MIGNMLFDNIDGSYNFEIKNYNEEESAFCPQSQSAVELQNKYSQSFSQTHQKPRIGCLFSQKN